jgi:hypothetical protein
MYYCHETQAKILLGVPEKFQSHMPSDYYIDTPVNIGGVDVWITASNKGPKGKSRFGHRVLAFCPKCPEILSYGRIHQHMKVHGINMWYRRNPNDPTK